MSARRVAAVDVLTDVLSRAESQMDAASTLDEVLRHRTAGFEVLLFAQRRGLLSHESVKVGIDSVSNYADQCLRNMRARIEAARGGMQVAA